MTRVLIYCRQSNADKEKDSLPKQEAQCRKYCEEKGYEIIAVLKENPGTSGGKFDAPELKQAMKAAKAGLYDIFLLRDLSRFARHRLKFELKELELKQHNVTVEYVWHNFEDTPTGRLHKHTLANFEEYERDAITERCTQGRRDAVEFFSSALVHGRPPLGYRSEKVNRDEKGKKFVLLIDEFEAEIVRTIFNLYVIENYSLNKIAEYLNSNRTPCWSRLRKNSNFGDSNSKWSASSVRVILKDTVYKGEYRYGKVGREEIIKIADGEIKTVYKKKKNEESTILSVKVDPIVSEEVWNKAQEKLSQNKNSAGRPTVYEYLLSRHVTCVCDSKMCGSRRKGKNDRLFLYYHCPKHDKRNGITCLQNNINAGKIDTQAWQWLEALLRDKDKLRKRIEEYVEDRDKELQPIYQEVGRLDEVIKRRRQEYNKLIDLYLSSSDYGQQELLPRKLDIESKLQADEAKQRELQEQLDSLGESVKWLKAYIKEGEWSTLSDSEKLAQSGWLWMSEFDEIDELREDKELSFEKKREYIEKFNLQVKLLGEDKILVSCDFAKEVLSLYDRKLYIPVRITSPFILHFSDILTLNFTSLPQFKQTVEA
jgi:site-specific DNA recombinase